MSRKPVVKEHPSNASDNDRANLIIAWLKEQGTSFGAKAIAADTKLPLKDTIRILNALASDGHSPVMKTRTGRFAHNLALSFPPSAPESPTAITPGKLTRVTTSEVDSGGTLGPGQSSEFSAARRYLAGTRMLVAGATGCMVLLGIELRLLRTKYCPKPGRPQKDFVGQERVAWDTRVKTELGIGHATASRYETLAAAVIEQGAWELSGADLLDRPLMSLPEARRTEIYGAVERVAGNRTASQLLRECNRPKMPKTKPALSPSPDEKEKAMRTYRDLMAKLEHALQHSDRLVHLPLNSDTENDINLHGLRDNLQELLRVTRIAIATVSSRRNPGIE